MKIKTKWDLKLLYKSEKDPQIEKDLKNTENAYAAFEKKYRGKPFTKSPGVLAKAIADKESMIEKSKGVKAWWYFTLKSDMNSDDIKTKATATRNWERLTKAFNRVKFFPLEIAKIPKGKHKTFLKHPDLEKYKYFLERIFEEAKYDLPEGEEQLESLLETTSYSMWVDSQQKLLNQQSIRHKGRDIPIIEIREKIPGMPKKERREAWSGFIAVLKSISSGAEAELNAIYSFKKITDERRGYKRPYSSTVISYENNEEVIKSLVDLVSKNFKISHRFYKLHSKLLKEKRLSHADINAKIGDINTKFDFKNSVKMLRSVLAKIDKEYLDIFDEFLADGHIDVYPKKGKRGGAYNWGISKFPTFLLLNHVNDIRSLETLAHEMGHAIHAELSKRQPPMYRGYSSANAEVASTFFEQVMSREIEETLPEKEKIILLHSRIQGDIATVFRQIACFNFELEMHERIREEGQLPKEEMAKIMRKHLESYMGPALSLTDEDGYFFVYWPHIRNFFYVYSYTYGQLISKALYERWKQDPSYAKEIRKFLLAGKSMSPENIFASIGIDISNPSFFEEGLKAIERDIKELEKLTSK